MGQEDRQLRGRRAGQQPAGRVGVLEVPAVDPLPVLDAQFAQQRDVRGRAAEADDADASPLAEDLASSATAGRGRSQVHPPNRHAVAAPTITRYVIAHGHSSAPASRAPPNGPSWTITRSKFCVLS